MAVTWIDYRKAYDMVPHSWMELFRIAVNMRSFVNAAMKQWNTELNAGKQRLGNGKIRCGIFQGDSLSPPLFVLGMILLTLVLKQTKASYEVKKGGEKINQLLLMDDLKLFVKNQDQIDSLVNTVKMFQKIPKWSLGYKSVELLITKRRKAFKSEGSG